MGDGQPRLYSDALETVINVVSAATAIVAIRIGEQPADANHPYGHQKAEYLSAVIEGALVLATRPSRSAATPTWTGSAPWCPPPPLLGLSLNGGAGFINLAWALVLLRLAADGARRR